MSFDYSNQVVIVTGGAKGIGRGISLAFGAAGATVVSADVDEPAGADLTAAAADLDGSVHFVAIDVSTADGCQSLVDTTMDMGGRVDVVCNNVGIQPMSSYVRAHELPEGDWDRILAVNLKSAFLMAKYAIPHMQAQGGGVIINTASVQGLQSAPMVSAYAASKGGILSLTQQLSLDYAVDNIRVLSVNPGTIDTPLGGRSRGGQCATGRNITSGPAGQLGGEPSHRPYWATRGHRARGVVPGLRRRFVHDRFVGQRGRRHDGQGRLGLTLYQVAQALETAPALFRNLRWDGHALLTTVLDRLQDRADRNAAAARSHARRR